MPLSVGELVAYLRVLGTGQAVTDLNRVDTSFARTGETASKAGLGIDRMSGGLANAGRQSAVAASGSARHRAAVLSEVAATERYNAVLAQENASLGRLAAAEAAVIRANERVAATSPAASLAATNTAAAASAGTMGRASAGFASATRTALGLGAAFGAFELAKKAVDITKEANTFDASMTRIQTVVGATDDEMVGMRQSLLDMSGDVAQAPDELATSLYHMESIGLRGAEALNAVRTAAKGAKIGNADLEETTNALTSTVASGIVKGGDFNKTMAQLLTIVGTGDMKLEDFNDALSSGLLTILKNSGVSLRDAGAALATFGDNNIRGANAATMLRVAVQALQEPAKGGAKALNEIGLGAHDLRDALLSGGLIGAVSLLRKHLRESGYDGKKAGALIVEAFGKKANTGIGVLIGQYGRLQNKYEELDRNTANFGKRWDQTTKTARFALQSLGFEVESAGISLAGRLSPALTLVAGVLIGGFRAGVSAATIASKPFTAAWSGAANVLGPVASVLGDVLGYLQPVGPVLKYTAGGVLALWAAYKGYQIARAATLAIVDGAQLLAGRAVSGYATFTSTVSSAHQTVTSIGQRSAAATEAAALQSTAAIDAEAASVARAKAREAVAYLDTVAASKAATDSQVADAEVRAAAATQSARTATIAATTSAEAAAASSTAIATSGRIAAIGWRSMLGPIGALAIGVGLVAASMHKSKTETDDAAEAAKAYTEAWSSGGNNRATLLDTITNQLIKADVPNMLAGIRIGGNDVAASLDIAALSGGKFVKAIADGGKPLNDLRAHLENIERLGNHGVLKDGVSIIDAANAVAASKLLKVINTQITGITKAQVKEIEQFKSLGTTAAPITKVADALDLTSTEVQTYAGMLGMAVTKNGDLVNATKENQQSILDMASAFNTATVTGSELLAAVKTFSGTTGTAADRAALIGATLKAGNGDALAYAASINAASSATRQLGTDVRSAAKQSKQGTAEYLRSIVDLKTGTIEYKKAGAGPLISDLQSMQTAAMNAAQATFQHARATKSGRAAATDAYNVYRQMTNGALVPQLKALGANDAQARRLAQTYFGMPKNVKTLIQQEGANPVVTVLNKIGAQLAILTGHPWEPTVKAPNTGPAKAKLADLQHELDSLKQTKNPEAGVNTADGRARIAELQREIDALHGKTVTTAVVTTHYDGGKATSRQVAGGLPATAKGTKALGDGWFTVGEEGGNSHSWELGYKHGSHVEIYSNAEAREMTGWTRVPGYAKGANDGKGKKAAEAASKKTSERAQKAADAVGSAIGGIGQSRSEPIDLTGLGITRVQAQIRHAVAVLHEQIGKGLSSKAEASARAHIRSLQADANRQLSSLRLKVRTTDLSAVRTALKGTADDVRQAFSTMIADARAAGAPSALTSLFGAARSRLVANQSNLASARDGLSRMTDYRNTIKGNLAQSFDSTKFGSIDDLVAGFGDATDRDQRYADNINSLRTKAKGDKTLTRYIAQLQADGDTTTLQTLAGASKTDLAKASRAIAANNTALTAGGNAATYLNFGKSITTQQGTVDHLVTEQSKLASSVASLAANLGKFAASKQHISLKIDGHKVTSAVVSNPQFEHYIAHVLHDIERHAK